jgi:hypothetical protein
MTTTGDADKSIDGSFAVRAGSRDGVDPNAERRAAFAVAAFFSRLAR